MSQRITTLRIDEILLFDGLVSEEQIRTALEFQREHGGKLGSHLLRLGFVSEEDLLKALAKQFGCESVVLTNATIPPEIVSMIPANVALARTVIPFDYDHVTNQLKIACEDPTDDDLLSELKFVAGGKDVRLHVAAEMSLRAAVAKQYVAAPVPSSAPAEINEVSPLHTSDTGAYETMPRYGTVLVVSDEPGADQPLIQGLEQEGYSIVSTDSADAAIDIIGDQSFHTVFIRDTVQGDYIDLIDRLRKVSPRTNVRYFESPAQLLLNLDAYDTLDDVVGKNLDLFTSLLSSSAGMTDNHAGTVGHYVDRLCRQMGIPDKDRLSIVNAAYLHDISRFYYGESEQTKDCRSKISLTAKLLDSLNYSPLVIGTLRAAYINLRNKYTKRLPIEKLGGNIITIVDIFCENITLKDKMSLDKFEAIRSHLTALSGKLFLPEVVKAFVEMIEEDILIEPISGKYNQALLYSEDLERLASVAERLRGEGFRPVTLNRMNRFVELYKRSHPDLIILVEHRRASRAMAMVDELVRRGVDITDVPTFLLASHEAVSELTSMFDRGIEDIIPLENSLDLLVVKMRKVRSRAEAEATGGVRIANSTSTMGNLADMNLIDLLQAMGPSRKTARIAISSKTKLLTLYLNKGQIVYAELGAKVGATAVYEAITWIEGNWVIQPVNESDLPEPNNELSNDAILMEGCRLLDESTRIPAPR